MLGRNQNTLWPEIRKLFGHGNDIISLAADPTGFHIASACRAQNVATATIRVRAVASFRPCLRSLCVSRSVRLIHVCVVPNCLQVWSTKDWSTVAQLKVSVTAFRRLSSVLWCRPSPVLWHDRSPLTPGAASATESHAHGHSFGVGSERALPSFRVPRQVFLFV